MQKRKLWLAVIAVTSIGAIPLAANADIIVRTAPPAPMHEEMPGARPGYVWAPGYHDYRGGRYVWVKGHWEREHRGMHYHPVHWVEREGHYVREGGRWDKERYMENHDRDHDGVPNRMDRDRDGDGVPNRLDRAPDNPRRQ